MVLSQCFDLSRFAYDPSEGNCVRFEYGGCQGNQNNFKTRRECVRACMVKRSVSAPVIMPIPEVQINELPPFEIQKIFLDPNKNRPLFVLPKEVPHRCLQRIDSGICHGYIPRLGITVYNSDFTVILHVYRFAFDEKSGDCIPFIYGGCGGNRNRFGTKEECRQACLR
ncbi:Kunitz/Bovine pancreatic trypsin inhibitor domain protein [Ancylostoma duodenale]|uniref:Kunitz/Bovine pancreatic trypsin inhibitor domain protein n=1 Tax=Ancylostoma duodenale TaxID=51022 RepID=A0A0C2DC14_9BILA|nr:Kunitz/Bovine pancreatic trypsin inhibitor domain protein [Ancylostoma duodenale]